MVNYILIAAFAFWFAELSTVPQTILIKLNTDKFKRLKPFDCTKCLSFWIALFYGFPNNILLVIFYAGLTSLIGIVFSKIYYKLLS